VPIQLMISIDRDLHTISKTPTVATFAPNPLPASARDQIFWSNNDNEPHWPGLLLSDDGKTINPTFFMPNKIAQDGDCSSTFSPTDPATFTYACSLHKNAQGVYYEQGVIKVT
jgi:plastocyanin